MSRYRAFVVSVVAGVLTAAIAVILGLSDLGIYVLTFGVGAVMLGVQARQEVRRDENPAIRFWWLRQGSHELWGRPLRRALASSEHRSTLALTSIFTGIVASTFVGFTTILLMGPIQHDLRMSISGVEMLWAAYLAPLLLMPVMQNRVGNRLPPRATFLGGILLSCAACAVAALAPTPFWLLLTRAGQGLSDVLILVASFEIVRVATFDEKRRGFALGLISLAFPMGLLLAASSTGLLAELVGWRGVFWSAAAVMAITLCLGRYGIGLLDGGLGGPGVDRLGVAVVSVGGAALLLAAYRIQTQGLDLLGTGVLFLVWCLAATFFVADQRRRYNLGLARVFRGRRLRLVLIGILGRTIQVGTMFFAAVYLALVAKLSEVLVSVSFLGFAIGVLLAGLWPDMAARQGGIRAGFTIPAVSLLVACVVLNWSVVHADTVGPSVGLVFLGFGSAALSHRLYIAFWDSSGVQSRRDGNASMFVVGVGALLMFLIVGGVSSRDFGIANGQALAWDHINLEAAFIYLAILAAAALVLALTVPGNGARYPVKESVSESIGSHL